MGPCTAGIDSSSKVPTEPRSTNCSVTRGTEGQPESLVAKPCVSRWPGREPCMIETAGCPTRKDLPRDEAPADLSVGSRSEVTRARSPVRSSPRPPQNCHHNRRHLRNPPPIQCKLPELIFCVTFVEPVCASVSLPPVRIGIPTRNRKQSRSFQRGWLGQAPERRRGQIGQGRAQAIVWRVEDRFGTARDQRSTRAHASPFVGPTTCRNEARPTYGLESRTLSLQVTAVRGRWAGGA